MKRALVILCCLVAAGGLFWLFPLFHVVRIADLEAAKRESRFNAAEFAKTFWNERLVPSLSQAPEATAVLKAFREEPIAAREKFGRRVGVSRTRLFLLKGSGPIVHVDKKGMGVALEPNGSTPDIVLRTGLLFGNTVRDATGLIDASSFPNSQQFNDVSTELNRIVETRVIPRLKEPAAAPDPHVQFVGCVEINDDTLVEPPLTIVPLDVRVRMIMERPVLSDGGSVPHER